MNVVPAQVAGVGSIAVASPPQRDNTGVFAGYPHPTVLAACALLGVDEVYAVGGAQAVAAFAFGFERPRCRRGQRRGGLRAGEPGDRPRQHLRRRRQALPQGRHRDRLRGRSHRDHGARRRHRRRRARRRRPGQQAEHDPQAASVLVTASPDAGGRRAGRGRAPGRPRPSTPSASQQALAGRQSGVVLVDDLDAGLAGGQRLRRRAPRAAGRRRCRREPRGSATPGRSSSAPTRRSASATTSPAPTTCCPPAAAPATAAACRCSRSCAACTSSTTDPMPCATVADHVVTLAQAEDLPAHGEAVQARFPDGSTAP